MASTTSGKDAFLAAALEIARVAANTARFNPVAAGEREFTGVLAVERDRRSGGRERHGDQLRELAVAQHCRARKGTNPFLRENFAGCGERFGEDGLLVTDAGRHQVKIFERQREKFGECAVVTQDAEYFASSAVCFQAAAAEFARAAAPERATSDIDFTHDAAAEPFVSCAGGYAANIHYLADELMARRSAK